jgi:hypothetical protein
LQRPARTPSLLQDETVRAFIDTLDYLAHKGKRFPEFQGRHTCPLSTALQLHGSTPVHLIDHKKEESGAPEEIRTPDP